MGGFVKPNGVVGGRNGFRDWHESYIFWDYYGEPLLDLGIKLDVEEAGDLLLLHDVGVSRN